MLGLILTSTDNPDASITVLYAFVFSVSFSVFFFFFFSLFTYRQLKFAIYMTTFTHGIACGWFLIACKGVKKGRHLCADTSWAELDGRDLGK